MKKILGAVLLLTCMSFGCFATDVVKSAKEMVWGNSGKSLDRLLSEHPLVERSSIKWLFDDTTNSKAVILEFSCFTVSKELAIKWKADSQQPSIWKITFLVGSQIVKVVSISVNGEPYDAERFGMFVKNLERTQRDYIGIGPAE